MLLAATAACTQSRKGIKGTEEAWIWGEVDMCDTYPDCEYAATHLIGQLNYTANTMDFEVIELPTDLTYATLASDEKITYRFLAKRVGEGKWRRMNVYSPYEGQSWGLSENMLLEAGDKFQIRPPIGSMHQYTNWILERVVQKGDNKVPYGHGDRLLHIEVQYAELEDR